MCGLLDYKVKSMKVKEGKKNTSLRLEGKTLKALKIKAIEEDRSVQAVIEELVTLYLDKKIKLAKKKKHP